jgi:hypothetical protein
VTAGHLAPVHHLREEVHRCSRQRRLVSQV